VLQRRRAALAGKDLKGFQATVDLTRPAFRRCQHETFDSAARQGFAAVSTNVVKVEPYRESYVRAYIDMGSSGIERVYFRREGLMKMSSDGWGTRPQRREISSRRTRTQRSAIRTPSS
jgi:hypothetical protein